MNLDCDLKKLADCNITELVEKIKTVPERRWFEDVSRQHEFAIHKHTQTIKLLQDDDARHENPTVHSGYREFKNEIAPCLVAIKKYFNSQLKYQRLQKKNGKGYFIRILITRLSAGGEISKHRDLGYTLSCCHRIHMPVITNGNVIFSVGDSNKSLKVGELWEINNRNMHSVKNSSNKNRVHLIMDYVLPGEKVKDRDGDFVC